MNARVQARLRRPAWRYFKRRRPGLHTIFGDAEARRDFMRAWINEPCGYALDLVAHFALKLLPIDACSAVGAFLGRVVMRHKYQKSVLHIRRNLELLFPQMDAETREAMLKRNCESLGRLMTEFSVLPSICQSADRVRVHGLPALQEAARERPVILVTLHLGNWEVLSSLSKQAGLAFHTFYLPLENPVEAWIAARTRKWLGAQLLPVAMAGVRPALKILKQGGMVSLFCDEGFNGQIRGPLLGRAPHLYGNLALAARLARHTDAKLCVVYAVRAEGARFDCHCGPIVELPERAEGEGERLLLEDVRYLNDVIEPVILEHADQWYFLHYRHEELAI